jgi:hypothetical protein
VVGESLAMDALLSEFGYRSNNIKALRCAFVLAARRERGRNFSAFDNQIFYKKQ